jgi:hypothetical protein
MLLMARLGKAPKLSFAAESDKSYPVVILVGPSWGPVGKRRTCPKGGLHNNPTRRELLDTERLVLHAPQQGKTDSPFERLHGQDGLVRLPRHGTLFR